MKKSPFVGAAFGRTRAKKGDNEVVGGWPAVSAGRHSFFSMVVKK